MLNLFAPANHLGVGVHAMNMARALAARGHEIALFPPFGSVKIDTDEVRQWLNNQVFFKASDPSLMIFDINFMAQFAGSPRIGFAVFETSELTPVQEQLLKQCDFVLTPSAWGREVLWAHEIDAHVVHEGFDPSVYEASFGPVTTEANGREFTFLHVGKFEERKGTLQLVRCFFRALEREEATLQMHIENIFVNDYLPILNLLGELGFREVMGQSGALWRRQGLKIRIVGGGLTCERMAILYQKADCCVFPTKGEGWGLPIMEAVVCGSPTIVGSWSGQREYLGAWPEEFALEGKLELARDGIWFHGDRGYWRVPSDENLTEKIKYAFQHARDYRHSAEWQKKVSEVRRFTWARAAEQFDNFMSENV